MGIEENILWSVPLQTIVSFLNKLLTNYILLANKIEHNVRK